MSTMYCAEPTCQELTLHSHCPSCSLVMPGSSPICAHHGMAFAEDWAVSNRIFCDLLHRAIEPPPSGPLPEMPAVEWA